MLNDGGLSCVIAPLALRVTCPVSEFMAKLSPPAVGFADVSQSGGDGPRDHRLQRLHVVDDLKLGVAVACEGAQANYLLNVLRLRDGARVGVFNGRDGEFAAEIAGAAKKRCVLHVVAQMRAQVAGPDVEYLFAPLKHARLDYMVQKATEMGVRCLRPVITQRTIAERVNIARMRANVIEAAEQCGVLQVPSVMEPVKLAAALAGWDRSRALVVCDEGASATNPLAALGALAGRPLAVLVGPEGGFSPEERTTLLAAPFVVAISLGPRIMRADTAAVAVLALMNATAGGGL
jgi:16S rRNA (uracil1498-N3)-methyltransferase